MRRIDVVVKCVLFFIFLKEYDVLYFVFIDCGESIDVVYVFGDCIVVFDVCRVCWVVVE